MTDDIEEQELRFRLLAELLPQLVWVVLPDGTIEYVNTRSQSYTGLSIEQLRKGGAITLVHPEDQEQSFNGWLRCHDTGEPFEMKFRIRSASDGTYRWFLNSSHPLRGKDGRIERWFSVCTDVDDQTRATHAATFLAEASALMASSLEPRELLEKAVKLIVPKYTEWCLVIAGQDDGPDRAIAMAHRNPAKEAELRQRRHLHEANASEELFDMLRVTQAVLIANTLDAQPAKDHARGIEQLARELELTSLFALPLSARGKIIGSLMLGSGQADRPLDETDVRTAEEFARLMALAVDNAFLHQQVRRTEQRFRILLATSSDGVWVANPQGAVIEEVVPWRAFTGMTFEESKGEGWANPLHEDDRERVMKAWAEALRTLSPYEVEYRSRRPDGTWAWAVARAAPVRNPDGSVREWIGSTTDITEKKQVEEDARRLVLERSARRRASLRADIGAALAGWSETNEALRACCAALLGGLGVARAQVWLLDHQEDSLYLGANAGGDAHAGEESARVRLGKSWVGLIARKQAPYLSHGARKDAGTTDALPPGLDGMTSFAGHPLLVGDHLIGVVTVADTRPLAEGTLEELAAVADVLAQGVQRRKMEEQLRLYTEQIVRANRELGQFAYVASHDLQEPLRMVTSYVQLLARRYRSKLDADAEEFIGYAVDGVNRMQRLIQDLLTYSRVETQGKPSAVTDSAKAFSLAMGRLDKVLREKGASVTSHGLPQVMADEPQLVQIFEQLLDNALKYRSEAPPRVEVTAQAAGQLVHFTVKDNGIGIEPQYFERIFVIFQRLHGKKEYPGTGIGLAICKKIVERHKGQIWVESTQGKGSTFHFTLPAVRSTD